MIDSDFSMKNQGESSDLQLPNRLSLALKPLSYILQCVGTFPPTFLLITFENKLAPTRNQTTNLQIRSPAS